MLLDESDDEDDTRPSRKRRLAERAAEGMEMEDDQVRRKWLTQSTVGIISHQHRSYNSTYIAN